MNSPTSPCCHPIPIAAPARADTTGSAHLRRLRGAGTSTAQCRQRAAWQEAFLWPLPFMLEVGCALRPPPHTGSGKAGRGVSLPFIPVRREVTAFWGWAQRGHRKEAEGSCSMCSVSYCWACGFSPPPLLNTNQNPSWEDKDRSYCCSCGNTPMAWAATAQPTESEALLAAR